jgi:hypothetical protein
MNTLIRCLLVSTVLASASGCYVSDAPPPPPATAVVADGYEPQYYDGYVVYYDDGGRPFYYSDGAVVWVPVTSPYYGGYVNHWHAYGPAYRSWYANHGATYRAYRQPEGRRVYGGGYRGGGTARPGAGHTTSGRPGEHHR